MLTERLHTSNSSFIDRLLAVDYFLILSFVKMTFWYRNAYIFYLICLFLLIFVSLFGITASGSKRWVNEENIFKLSKPYILPRSRVQDIDNLEDLKHAELLFKMNL